MRIKKITVEQAARLMDTNPTTLSRQIKAGAFSWAVAAQTDKGQHRYAISPAGLAGWLGLTLEELNNELAELKQ